MNLIPEGTWAIRGVSYALGYTSGDNEQVGVELEFQPDQHEDVDGRHITWYGQFSEKAEPFTLKTLRTLGWVGDDISDLSGIVDGPVCEAVIQHEADLQGETRARVRFINALGAGGVAMKSRMSTEQAAAFAERMRGKAMAMGKAAPPSAATPKPAAPKPAARPASPPARKREPQIAPPDDDNIPFIHNEAEAWGEEHEQWTARWAARQIV